MTKLFGPTSLFESPLTEGTLDTEASGVSLGWSDESSFDPFLRAAIAQSVLNTRRAELRTKACESKRECFPDTDQQGNIVCSKTWPGSWQDPEQLAMEKLYERILKPSPLRQVQCAADREQDCRIHTWLAKLKSPRERRRRKKKPSVARMLFHKKAAKAGVLVDGRLRHTTLRA